MVDENFQIAGSGGVNIYFRVSNILDRRNIIGVYSATGRPDDPGLAREPGGPAGRPSRSPTRP